MRILYNLRMKSKLFVVTSLAVVCIIGLAAGLLVSLKHTLLEDKKAMTRQVVETAYGVLDHFHTLSKEGKLTEEEAKSAARAALASLRYAGKEYFWINDDTVPYPTMIMHPTIPALDGKVLDDQKFNCATSLQQGAEGSIIETDGKKNLFQSFVEVSAGEKGQGFVTYRWQKPLPGGGVTEEHYPKLSFVKKFAPWKWIVGSGVYLDDIDAAFWSKTRILGITIALFIVLLASVGWYLGQVIASPLAELTGKVEQMAGGNLSVAIEYKSRDEAGVLAENMNYMVSSFKSTLQGILTSAADVLSSMGMLTESAQKTSEGARNQSIQAAQIAAASEEMSQTITDIARNATQASDTSTEAMRTAENGKNIAVGAVETINLVRTSTTELSGMIGSLNGRVSEIGEIVTVINDIADQTSLLALNAAIEAARAGEQGRGFAVVADEVRKLAERTIRATTEITGKIRAVQEESKQTAHSMEEASGKVETATDYIRQVEDSLNHIVESVQGVKDQITQIATAVEEQASASEEVTRNIERTSSIANDMEKMAEGVMNQVSLLASVAESLRVSCSGFTLEGGVQQERSGTGGFIQWSNNYSVHVGMIDDQHKEIIRLVNEMHDALRQRRSRDILGTILNELADYAVKHFKVEEDLFQKYGYPEEAVHKEAHAALVRRVVELQKDFEIGRASINTDVMNFLKDWLINHILRTDKRYSAFMNSKGVV
ncbi:MAG: bacteriohemerythrin [Alphaproteobacteria bacterium]|uniref:Bacteriohemerythrin n=1 Tax=Candidatus Nitrobium versatile TaxID=2884831 RepID=A0A953M3X8_9BACT|nr:bacteriohemerythrin [Candidatus Nitrobium versatile]